MKPCGSANAKARAALQPGLLGLRPEQGSWACRLAGEEASKVRGGAKQVVLRQGGAILR